MQILCLLYFTNPIGIKSTGPFWITLKEWEVEENKSFLLVEKNGRGEVLYHVCSKCCLKEILTRPG